jgi:rare lipoprotein A
MSLAPGWRSLLAQAALWLALAALSGCGSAPPKSSGGGAGPAVVPRTGPAPGGERDGADANPPPDLAGVPDAAPRLEPIRLGGPNKPYQALGRDYVPITDDRPFNERGLASWYGRKFHGRRTSSGEVYDMYAMTAAHPTLPIPSYARVRNPANNREVVVRINDRGPFHPGRVLDLSYTAAYKLGVLRGVSPVELRRITFDEIRSGSWRKDGTAAPADESAAASGAPVAGTPAASSARTVNRSAAATAPTVIPSAAATAPAVMPSAAAPAPAVMPSAAASAASVPAAASADAAAAAAPAPPAARPGPGFWVQLGAFRQRDGADGFQRHVTAELGWLAPLLGVFADANAYRLQAGPYPSRDEAQGAAKRVRDALQLVPVIVERR